MPIGTTRNDDSHLNPPAPCELPEALVGVNLDGFAKEIEGCWQEIRSSLGWSDYLHLRKIERWGRLGTAFGYALAWIAPNPISAALICQGRTTRWLMGHHIFHRGYDRIPGVPRHYTSRGFALGWRRYTQWFDWWLPEAWDHMHTTLHHSNTSDPMDADLVEVAPSKSRWLRTLFFLWNMFTWKWSYYAFYTMREFQIEEARRKGNGEATPVETIHGYATEGRPTMRRVPYRIGLADYFNLARKPVRDIWLRCILSFGLFQFVLVPLLFLPLGKWAAFSVLCNVILADLLCNFQGYVCNRPSHTGADLYRFEGPAKSKGEFYVRQVLSSTNYNYGSPLQDFTQFWINYQVEHHLWPALPMSKYTEYAPRVRALCAKYGLPYTQQSIWRRLKAVYDVSMGDTQMTILDTRAWFPKERRSVRTEALS